MKMTTLEFPLTVLCLLYLTACCYEENKAGSPLHNGKHFMSKDFDQTNPSEDHFPRRLGIKNLCSVHCQESDENKFLYQHEQKFPHPAGVLHCLVKCAGPNCQSCQISIADLHLDKLIGNVTILNISAEFKEEENEMLTIELVEVSNTISKTQKPVDLLIFGNLACDWPCFETLLSYVNLSQAGRTDLPSSDKEIQSDLNVLHHTQQRGLYLWNWWETEESYSHHNFSSQTMQISSLSKLKSLIIHQDVLLHIPQSVVTDVCSNPCIQKSLHVKVSGCYIGQTKSVPPSLRHQVWPNLEYLELQLSNLTEESLIELNTSLPSLKYLKIYLIWNCETYNPLPEVLTSFNWNSLCWRTGVILVCFSKEDKLERNTLKPSATLDFLNKTSPTDMVPTEVYMYKENTHPFAVYINMSYKGLKDLPDITFNMHAHFINLNLSRNNIKSAQIYKKFTPKIQEPPVKVLDLSYNKLTENTTNDYLLFIQLQELNLSHNHYTVIPYHTVPKQYNRFSWIQKFIHEHDGSGTLHGSNKLYLSEMLYELRTLDLSYNKIHQIDLYSEVIESTLLPIRGLFFQHNKIQKIPKIVFTNRYISVADFSHNEITFLNLVETLNNVDLDWLNGMPNNIMTKLVLDYNNFTIFNESFFTYDGMSNALVMLMNFNVHLHENPITCDCTTYEFYTMLAMLRYMIEHSPENKQHLSTLDFYLQQGECQTPENFFGRPLMMIPQYEFRDCFQHETIPDCPHKCFCYKDYGKPANIVVNCTGNELTEMPTKVPEFTTKLLLNNNSITSVLETVYMKELSILDLSWNAISVVSEDFLSNDKGNLKSLDLSSNKIARLPKTVQYIRNTLININYNTLHCGCDTVWMRDWLMNSTKYVKDWRSILCFSGPQKGTRVINMNDKYPECDGKTTYLKDTVIKLVGGIVSVFIIGITLGVVVFWYRGEIKVWLYARFRWHPWDKGDDDITDKDYDAFVSYSQSDVTWVRNELMPFLESEKNQFQLCVHVRDFVPGVTITKNIMTAIDCSRRTILVLSKEFLKSEWCHLEFQAAHQKALQDRSNYLIVILLEDINPKDLDGSLKLYMKTNTYVNAEDAWFERKLLYAMPEKSIAAIRNEVRVATKPLVLKVEAGDTEDGENVHEFLASIESTASYGTWDNESENGDSGAFSETTFGSNEAEHGESAQRGLGDSLITSSDYARESQKVARRKNKKHRRSMVRNLPPLFRRLLNYEHLEESCEEVEGGYIMIHD